MRHIMFCAVLSLLLASVATIVTKNEVAGIYLGSILIIGVLCWKAGDISGYNRAIDEMGRKRDNVRITDAKPAQRANARQQTVVEDSSAFMGEVVIEQRHNAQQ